MASINLTHDQLGVLASAVRMALKADEGMGLLAAETDEAYESLSGSARQYLTYLAADIEAVAQEHRTDDLESMVWKPVLAERLLCLAEFRRILRRSRSVGEADQWCELNERLIEAVADR